MKEAQNILKTNYEKLGDSPTKVYTCTFNPIIMYISKYDLNERKGICYKQYEDSISLIYHDYKCHENFARIYPSLFNSNHEVVMLLLLVNCYRPAN